MATMSFEIFARDFASKTFDKVGDSADRLGRRIDSVGKAASGVRGHVESAGSSLSGFGSKVGAVGGILGGFGSTLGAVGSGLAGLGSKLGTVGVSLTGTALRFSLMGAGAASAASSAISLGAALAPAAGILAGLPGAALLGAGAMSVLKVALSGVGDAFSAALGDDYEAFLEAVAGLSPAASAVAFELNGLKNGLDDIRRSVQDALFAPLQGELTALYQTLGGPLQTGMSQVAGQLGRLAGQLLQFGQSAAAVNLVSEVFSTLRGILEDIESRTVQRLLQAMARFAQSTLPAFQGLGDTFNQLAERFTAFLNEATAAGDGLRWINEALVVLSSLGDVAGDVLGIISAVFDAAAAGGGNTLGVLGQLVSSVRDFFDSAQGRSDLVDVFRSLSDVGRALFPIVKAVIGALADIAPVAAAVATALGPGIAAAVRGLGAAAAAIGPGLVVVAEQLARAFANPVIQKALLDIGVYVGMLLQAVAPLIPSLIQLAGQLAGALLTALVQVGPQLLAVVVALGPGLVAAVQAIGTALAALGPGLITVATALSEAFAQPEVHNALVNLATGVSGLLVAVAPLLPPLLELAAILVDRLGSNLALLTAFLDPVVRVLAEVLTPLLPEIARLFREVSAALLPVAEQFGGALAGALRDLQPHIGPIMDALREAGSRILTAILDVLPQITPHFKDLARAFADLLVEVSKIMPDLIKLGTDVLVELIKQAPILIPMVTDLALQFLALFKELTPLLPKLTKLLLDAVLPLIPELPKLLPPLISLVTLFTDLLREATPLLNKLLESETVAAIVKIGSKNMVLAFNLVKDSINFAVGAIQTFLGIFIGAPGQVQAGLDRMGGAVKGWANSIIGWFESIINIIADVTPGMGHVSLPRLANGAIVDQRTIAMIGEAGREVVIPLTRPGRALQLADESGLTAMIASRMPGAPPAPRARNAQLAGQGPITSRRGGGFHIENFYAAPNQSPRDIAEQLYLLSMGRGY